VVAHWNNFFLQTCLMIAAMFAMFRSSFREHKLKLAQKHKDFAGVESERTIGVNP
jgi:hypothetical protein